MTSYYLTWFSGSYEAYHFPLDISSLVHGVCRTREQGTGGRIPNKSVNL